MDGMSLKEIQKLPPAKTPAFAVGAGALGILALGAVALGSIAIGALAIRRARVKSLVIDELTVRRLNVLEEISQTRRPPYAPRAQARAAGISSGKTSQAKRRSQGR
ncbi:hypothetical protein IZ6_08390 [Terrihabitans soli]|uniref:Uncharacterized protein n=1 Tax=Terrihabitans soli TaxID=708113 RepID=A0A6S6QIN4_9HYPH|nr:hypothetical protein IZ6_08390 [Terrihabitans soli]